jgi:hypothetical protein
VIRYIVTGLIALILLPILIGLLTKEAEGWLAVLPFGLLRLAKAQLPASRRSLYDEWSAELQALLQEMSDRPLSRLIRGVMYSSGLIWAARTVAREIGNTREPDAEPDSALAPQGSTDFLLLGAGGLGNEFQVFGRRFKLSFRLYGTGYDRQEVEQLLEEVATTPREDLAALAEAKLYPLYAPRFQFSLVAGGYFEGDVDAAIKELHRMIIGNAAAPSRPQSRSLESLFRKIRRGAARQARAKGSLAASPKRAA